MSAKRERPIAGQEYSLREILETLDLLDAPALRFKHDEVLVVIQDSHVTEEQLLSVPGLAETRWRYVRTTYEWIPLFTAVDDGKVKACVTIEPRTGPRSDGKYWVCPKGFPRMQ